MRRGSLFGLIFLLVASALGVVRPAGAAEPTFPPGFSVTAIETGQGQFNLTDFVFLPAGGFLTTGKDGLVTHVGADGVVTNVAQWPVATDGDLGLLGLDLALDYAQTGRLYAVYAYNLPLGGWSARLVRWTVDNPAVPRAIVNEVVVVDGIDQTNPYHTIGKVHVDTDGTLWFGQGDASNPFKTDPAALRAQDITLPQGKLFHVNPNGTGVADNPFYDSAAPSSWKSRVWAYGLRNPFRFTLHSDGTPYIGDVGQNLREEMDVGVRGGNFGWPCWEGTVRPAFRDLPQCQALYASGTTIPPLFDLGRIGTQGSITGGDFAWGDTYPEPYANSMFFGDYIENSLSTFETDAAHALVRAPEGGTGKPRTTDAFARTVGGAVSIRRSPAGEIHYAAIYSGEINRISYSAGNRPPTARGSAETSFGNPTVKFFGSDSSDPDGDPLTYEWDFGDGATSTEANPTHQYATAERYTATLTVRDPSLASGSTQVPVVLDDHNPTLLVTGPPSSQRFRVDEAVTATAVASDVEDADLGPDDVEWRADIIHCTGADACHTHPGRTSKGPEFTMPFPDHGSGVSLNVNAQVRDSVGHVERRSFEAKPQLQTLTMTSSAGAPLQLNGEPVPAGGKVVLVAGSRNVAYAYDGTNKLFSAWTGTALSGGGSPTENPMTFAMPVSDASLTAEHRDVSLNVSFSGGITTPLHAHVSPAAAPTDSFGAPSGIGCTVGAVVGGDDGDGRLETGETWTVPCFPGPAVQWPSHPITITAPTINGGAVTGGGVVPIGIGYRMVASDGGIFSFGEAPFFGSMGGTRLNQPVIAMEATPSGNGYWMVARDGGMFSFGDAPFFGSKGGEPLPAPIVAMATTPTGNGYWMVGADGSVYAFGGAPVLGGLTGVRLAQPIVDMAPTRSGKGYWLVAADGGVFAFGDAPFFGSMGGVPLNLPVVGMTPTASGNGYWQVALDGGVFSFGDAPFYGSMGGQPLNEPVVGMAVSPTGNGYWQVATDGGMFSFGDAPFFGSMGGTPLNQPVVGMTTAVVAKVS